MREVFESVWNLHELLEKVIAKGWLRSSEDVAKIVRNYKALQTTVNSLDYAGMVTRKINLNSVDVDCLAEKYLNKGYSDLAHNLRLLFEYVSRNEELWDVFWINGSLGDGSFKRGWSDADVFIVLSEIGMRRLPQTLTFLDKVNQIIFELGDLQLHGVFVATPLVYSVFTEKYFPVLTLGDGIVLVSDKFRNGIYIRFSKRLIDESRRRYFRNDIWSGLQKRRAFRNIVDRIFFIHRVYSFPFAYLQMLGMDVTKKESFSRLASFARERGLHDVVEAVDIICGTYEMLSFNGSSIAHTLKGIVFPGMPLRYAMGLSLLGWYLNPDWRRLISEVSDVLRKRVLPVLERLGGGS